MSVGNARSAWANVGDELEALGLKLKLHVEQEFDEDHEMESAFGRVAEALDDAADAVANIVRDEAVREDAKNVGRNVVSALAASYRHAAQAIRDQTHAE